MSPMNNRLLVPRKTPGLLDLVPGAAAAYSLRSLSNSYADPVVTVRRSSGGEEEFTASEVADGTLAAFCGAGDGFVKQWWDQSGNARHASQTTPGYQPKIVSSGAVLLEEGKPAIQFDGTDDALYDGGVGLSIGLAASIFCVARDTRVAPNKTSAFLSVKPSSSPASEAALELGVYNKTNFRVYHKPNGTGTTTDTFQTTGISLGDLSLLVAIKKETSALLGYEEGVSVVDTSVSDNSPIVLAGGIAVGRHRNTTDFADMRICEVILYPSDQTANRELLEGNIAWGWSV